MRGDEITIRSGVGTPSTINVLAFSQDDSLLAAGKDFGRVVVWEPAKGLFVRAIDTGQGIVKAVAISPDNQFVATAGQQDQHVLIWRMANGTLARSLQVDNSPVQSLAFAGYGNALVESGNGGPVSVFDANSGQLLEKFPGEWSPILSTDGRTLLTVLKDRLVLRDTQEWKKVAEIPRLTISAWPLALNTESDRYVYGDPMDDHNFVSVWLSTGELSRDQKFGKLPGWNPSEGGFAAFDRRTGIVFGHSGGHLWAWEIETGKICLSPVLYNESGALSADGTMLVGGMENSIFATNKTKPGVALWRTDSILKACGMEASAQ